MPPSVKNSLCHLTAQPRDSGDIAGDDKILARVVDAYRRIRNTLRFLLANTSDFDIHKDAVPLDQLLEIDRYALARAAQFQAEVLAHYKVYEFHPVVAKLQVYCSEDLGAFYLDILKDRLYTTAAGSRARRSAQTALWHIGQAMLRWMAPFLSFTAEEAWKLVGNGESIFTQTFSDLGKPDQPLLNSWSGDLKRLRTKVMRTIELKRQAGQIGSSLQAEVTVTCSEADASWLRAFDGVDNELKFLFLNSKFSIKVDPALNSFHGSQDLEMLFVDVVASPHPKCERCWHYRADVGHDPAHPTICGRCTSNLFGAGESRTFA
jgi:isoleucyl-tRNA synthetase